MKLYMREVLSMIVKIRDLENIELSQWLRGNERVL